MEVSRVSAHGKIRKVAIAGVALLLLALPLSGCFSPSRPYLPRNSGAELPKKLTIGFSSVLSGQHSADSEVSEGAKIYFEKINAEGGVEGHTFKFDEKDNAYSASKAVRNARDLVLDEPLEIIVSGARPTHAVRNIAYSLNTAVMGVGDEAFSMPLAPACQDFFAQDPPYGKLAAGDAKFIMDNLKTKHFAFAYEPDVAKSVVNKLPAYMKKHGGTIDTTVPVKAGTTGYGPAATKLKNSGAAVVYVFARAATFAGLQAPRPRLATTRNG